MKKRLCYGKRRRNSLETAEEESDSDQPKCSKSSPKKRRAGGEGSKLSPIEQQYIAGYDSQIGDSVRMSDLGIDLNVKIRDLTMDSVRMALHRMFRLMRGRPGYISMTAGALLRSLTGDALRFWYTSANGINITFPGRPYLVVDHKSFENLIEMIRRNLDEIINNCKISFPASGWVLVGFTNLKVRLTYL